MRAAWRGVLLLALPAALWAQSANSACACGANPPKRPAQRTSERYANTPDDMRPFGNFTTPYYEHYTKIVEYNGAARDAEAPDLSQLDAVRVGFLGPLYDHPDEALGKRMLHGSEMAIDEANAAGGYGGKPFKLMLHNDGLTWGSSSNEIVKMVYDEKVWGMLGSISGDSTHIGLRVALRAELPMVNSAATDPTIPETIIPWYLTVIQDDRVQGYTLARRIFTDLGMKRVALLRVNDRYGRFGVMKFRDAAKRLGHMVAIEQKYMPGDTDFGRQLRVINDSNVDAIVLWADAKPAAGILKQMRAMGMKQRVFGSFRVYGADLLKDAGPAAEGLEFVYPFDLNRDDPAWLAFKAQYEKKYGEPAEAFSGLAYDAMKILLSSICQAGLNKGLIRDSLTSLERYQGVTGAMTFDPNCKNVVALYKGTVHDGKIDFSRYPMQIAYAKAGESGVAYAGPPPSDAPAGKLRIALFGPNAKEQAEGLKVPEGFEVVSINSDGLWGKSSTALVEALGDASLIGVVTTDRNTSHLAEQLSAKLFIPLVAVTADKSVTAVNIPWVFRAPADTSVQAAVQCLVSATGRAGPNRDRVRQLLASGQGSLRFDGRGEPAK